MPGGLRGQFPRRVRPLRCSGRFAHRVRGLGRLRAGGQTMCCFLSEKFAASSQYPPPGSVGRCLRSQRSPPVTCTSRPPASPAAFLPCRMRAIWRAKLDSRLHCMSSGPKASGVWLPASPPIWPAAPQIATPPASDAPLPDPLRQTKRSRYILRAQKMSVPANPCASRAAAWVSIPWQRHFRAA